MYQNLRLPILFVLLLLLPIYIQANTITSIQQQQPDDAFCSSFSGINSTCSTCIEHGCIYCDSEGTGVGGTCISHNISQICPPKSSALITCPSTQLQQLQPSQQKQQSQQRTHSQYESNSIYLPIQLSVIILMITCYMGWKIQPSYAIPPTTNNESIPFKPVIVLTTQEGLDQPLLTSTLDAPVQPPTLTLTPQLHQQSGSPWEATLWYRLMLYLILVGLTCISIMSVILDSWSTIVTRDTIIVYGSSGDYTLSHDITLWSHYSCDQTSLQCRTHAIMMMITRILTISSASCLCLVMIHMSVSLLSHRSFSAYSFTMIYGACVSHILALVIFSTGPYLIQTSVNEPNIPQLSITWEMTLLAILINIIILLPMTWLHITNTTPPPSCWNPLSNVSLDDIVVDDMTCTSPSGTLCTCAACVGLGVSAPIEKMIVVTEYHTGKQD